MGPLLQVAIGGAIGAVLRYVTVLAFARQFGTGFPWGTLTVNVIGCLIMGALIGALGPRFAAAPLVLTGVLGGFTTFSAFSVDTLALVESGQAVLAAGYVTLTLVTTLAACALGYAVMRGVLA